MTDTRSVIVEKDFPFAPEKIWRALTTPHLLSEWLMQTDFALTLDHQFQFRGDWGAVDCKVLAIEPNRLLSYTWGAMGLGTVVTWTLTPSGDGTHLRLEQAGFGAEEGRAYQGAKFGWPKFLGNLEQLLARE